MQIAIARSPPADTVSPPGPPRWHGPCNVWVCTGYGWTMRRWAWGLGWVLAGCSEMNAKSESPMSTGFESDPDTGADTGDTTIDLPDTELFSVNVSFSLLYGEWAPDPVLRVDLYSPEVELVCSQVLPVLSITADTPPEGEPILAWWLIELGDGVPDTDCPDWPARSWHLGLGAYDVRLDPAMAARDMLGYDVYGLYLQEHISEPVYVIGIAGTSEMLAGTPDLTVETPPLADGAYNAFSLLTLTLE
jgi:hypothetical protein